jgi:SAM-dependent methyltransferase
MFLDLHMSQHPFYPTILSRFTNSPATRLLDVGCGLGQDVRKLVFDGVPAKQIYAVELKAGLISAGHDLFMDGGKEGITFLQGDAINDDIRTWKKDFQIEEGFEMIHTGALFHLFAWETQLTIAKNLVELVHGKDEAVIFGWTFAAHEAGLRSVGPNKEAKVYGHNEESARRFWKEVGDVTGTEWEIEVRFAWADVGEATGLAKGGNWGDADGNGMMWFSVRRV